jgi:hypothetical protein
MRWHYRDALLLWLFVPAYLLHLAEEFFGGPGLPAWFALIIGRQLSQTAFLLINAVALVLLVASLRAAIRRESWGWVAVAVATLVTLNAVLHLLGSLATGTYSPGLVTGLVIYMPLGQLTLLRAWHQQPRATFARGVAAGVVIHAIVAAAAVITTL